MPPRSDIVTEVRLQHGDLVDGVGGKRTYRKRNGVSKGELFHPGDKVAHPARISRPSDVSASSAHVLEPLGNTPKSMERFIAELTL